MTNLKRNQRNWRTDLGEAARQAKIPYHQTRVGSMLGGFFTKGPVTDYVSAKKSDTARYAKFFHGMLKQGIYFAPSQFEAAFLSTAHSLGTHSQDRRCNGKGDEITTVIDLFINRHHRHHHRLPMRPASVALPWHCG